MDYASIYPCIGLTVRGRIGQWWIHKEYKTYKVVTKYYVPTNPQTALQQAWRQVLSDAVTNWQGFDVPTKQFYNSKITPKYMSGYNRYLRLYLNANYPPALGVLLLETGDRILLETGDGILL